MGNLNDLAAECHRNSREHGFWDHNVLRVEVDPIIGALTKSDGVVLDNPSIWAEKIALIHSEASEMLECLRKRKSEDALAYECADVLIRLLDFTAARGLNIERAVRTKMIINENREHLHGGNF
jgi:hypothetical protein